MPTNGFIIVMKSQIESSIYLKLWSSVKRNQWCCQQNLMSFTLRIVSSELSRDFSLNNQSNPSSTRMAITSLIYYRSQMNILAYKHSSFDFGFNVFIQTLLLFLSFPVPSRLKGHVDISSSNLYEVNDHPTSNSICHDVIANFIYSFSLFGRDTLRDVMKLKTLLVKCQEWSSKWFKKVSR